MSRLIGQRSNTGSYLGLLVVISVIAAGVVEYFGITDVIPEFGHDQIELKFNRQADVMRTTASQKS